MVNVIDNVTVGHIVESNCIKLAMNGNKNYRGKCQMGVEPTHDLSQSVESERKIMDSNPIRGTFPPANQ